MPNEVERHYSTSGRLSDAIRDDLIASGKDMGRLELKDLETIDEFYIRGRSPTLDLAHRLSIEPGSSVLDIGSGLGGPARTIAANFHCHVTGVDLTWDFCEAGERAVSLGRPIEFRHTYSK